MEEERGWLEMAELVEVYIGIFCGLLAFNLQIGQGPLRSYSCMFYFVIFVLLLISLSHGAVNMIWIGLLYVLATQFHMNNYTI